MFLRRTRGLRDFVLAALCLWGAVYHTPVGAGFRAVLGIFVGRDASVRSVLSYYNAGIYAPDTATRELVLPKYASVNIPEQEALGWGVHAAWMRTTDKQRMRARELAFSFG